MQRCDALPPVTCAIVHPCDCGFAGRRDRGGAREPDRPGADRPGGEDPRRRRRRGHRHLAGFQIVDVEHSHAAADARRSSWRAPGDVEALMKGSLHTDELMAAVVPSATGLRTARRISHVFVLDVPTYPRLLMVTDAAINIEPDLDGQGRHLPERDRPRARARHRQAEGRDPLRRRDRQPEDPEHARRRGAVQDGRPRPDHRRHHRRAARLRQRDLGRGRAHQEDRLAGRRASPTSCWCPTSSPATWWRSSCSTSPAPTAAGIVLGTRVPIVLTSRADGVRSRLASTAVLKLVAHDRRSRLLAPPA